MICIRRIATSSTVAELRAEIIRAAAILGLTAIEVPALPHGRGDDLNAVEFMIGRVPGSVL